MNINDMIFIEPQRGSGIMKATLNGTNKNLFFNTPFVKKSWIKKGDYLMIGKLDSNDNFFYIVSIDANKQNGYRVSGNSTYYIPIKMCLNSLGIKEEGTIKYKVEFIETGIYKVYK